MRTAPAVQTVGQQTVTREADDLVFIVDDDDVIVDENPATVDTLQSPPAVGDSLESALGYSSATLDDRDTVSVETTTGNRRYDPQVSVIRDGDTQIGAALSLRDVSDRELREQRLSVLNRALRHNLRNKIDVVRGHTEVLETEHRQRHVAAILDTAEEIEQLGTKVREVDQFVSDSTVARVDVTAVVDEVTASVEATHNEVTVTMTGSDSARVTTNPGALDAAVESAVTNAAAYTDTGVEVSVQADRDQCEVVISDDGPGIPERELNSLRAERETPLTHSTGLGLWQLKWAVTTMGGGLSFETDDGTTVRFTIPDRQGEPEAG